MTPRYDTNLLWEHLTQVDPNFVDFFSTQVRCNRLIAGLVFPALQDEDLVICPDWSSTELSRLTRNILGDTEDSVKEEPDSDQEYEDFQSSANINQNDNSNPGDDDLSTKANISSKRRTRSQVSYKAFYDFEEEDRTKSSMNYNKKSAFFPGVGSGGSRKARCMSCPACLQPDCRACKYCIDMKKYGGPGVKKQSCEHRPKCHAKEKGKAGSAEMMSSSRSDTDTKCSSDLDDVESLDDPTDENVYFDRKRHDTTQACQKYSTTKSSRSFDIDRKKSYDSACAKLSQSSEDESQSAKNIDESLKCSHCEFIGKTESGLKKHKIRYHRSRQGSREESHPVDAKNSVKFKDSGKRKVIDAWHVKNVPSDGNNGNSLKRHKTNGYVIDN